MHKTVEHGDFITEIIIVTSVLPDNTQDKSSFHKIVLQSSNFIAVGRPFTLIVPGVFICSL